MPSGLICLIVYVVEAIVVHRKLQVVTGTVCVGEHLSVNPELD